VPVFSRDALDADRDELDRLRLVLHGPSAPARAAADRPARPPGPDLAKSMRLLVDRRRDAVR
jgi:hypothetical protein